MNNRPIGIFDSGSGGLTVLAELQKQLPAESAIYYGDLARMPYGSKTRKEIIAFNQEIVGYLVSRQVKMVIVACNTSSALAFQETKDAFPQLPLVGIISPGAQAASIITKNKKIGVLATQGTVRSQAYKNMLLSLNPSLEIYQQACPKFVPLIEANNIDGPELRAAIEEYLLPLLEKGVDTIIHGCTHYPLIEEKIRQQAGNTIEFVNPAIGAVSLAKEILEKEKLLASGPAKYEFIATVREKEKYVRVDGRGKFFRGAPVIQ